MPLTNVLGNLFVIVLAGLGGWLALQGLVTVGHHRDLHQLRPELHQPLRQLANLYNTIQAALAGAERVFEIIDTPPEMDDAPAARRWSRVRGATFASTTSRFGYRPDAPIIKDMTLEAKPGQTVALVGPTGAGKTTIINLLTRFYEIDAAASRSTATTSATSARTTCAASSGSCCRTPSSSPPR